MVQMFHVAKTRPLLPNKLLATTLWQKGPPCMPVLNKVLQETTSTTTSTTRQERKKLFPGGTLCLMPPSIDVLGRQFCDNSVPVALRRSWLRASPTSIVGHSGALPQPGRQRQPDASPVQLHMFHQYARAGSEAAKRHGIQSNIFRALFN